VGKINEPKMKITYPAGKVYPYTPSVTKQIGVFTVVGRTFAYERLVKGKDTIEAPTFDSKDRGAVSYKKLKDAAIYARERIRARPKGQTTKITPLTPFIPLLDSSNLGEEESSGSEDEISTPPDSPRVRIVEPEQEGEEIWIQVTDNPWENEESSLINVVGFKPTMQVLPVSKHRLWGYKNEQIALGKRPMTSFWKKDPTGIRDPDPINKAKLKMGTDVYLQRNFIDESGAYHNARLNDASPQAGQPEPTNVKLHWEGFIWGRTKAKKLKANKAPAGYQINPGIANHYSDTPVENLVAAGRYGKLLRRPKLNSENKKFVDNLVSRAFEEHWEPQPIDELEENFIIDGALSAAHQRNYHGRAEAEPQAAPRAIFAGKAQVKPMKNGKLNLDKGGQGIMQTPASFNLKWIGFARVMSYRMKKWAKSNFFLDDRENDLDFRTRMTQAIKEMPISSRFAVVDSVEFDSYQNDVTVYLESKLWEKFGFSQEDIYDFQEWRREANFTCPGLLSGVTNGEKGSGFLDTKSGNTALQVVLTTAIVDSIGEVIESAKGDDDLKVGSGLSVNEKGVRDVALYTGMQQSVDIGDGAEFIGTTVNRNGMYKNPLRVARKIVANPIRDEAHFVEVQKSWRQNMKEWKESGLHESIGYSAMTERANQEYGQLCTAFVESMSHISWQQFQTIAKFRVHPKFQAPSPLEIS
jgi:hypothetical protein